MNPTKYSWDFLANLLLNWNAASDKILNCKNELGLNKIMISTEEAVGIAPEGEKIYQKKIRNGVETWKK